MSNTENVKPKYNTVEVKESEVHSLVPEGNIFTFRTPPVDFGRWTITDINVNLPGTPRTVFVEIKFPPNGPLNVSDNFSTVVAQAKNNLIQVNVWRTDKGENPSINFAYDVLVII
jgi:hypothetical protein